MESNDIEKSLLKLLSNFRNPKKVLLIRVPSINYETFDIPHHKAVGYSTHPPISITTLYATLEKKLPNVELKVFDAEYETLKEMFSSGKKENILEKMIKKLVLDFKPDVVGLSVIFSPGIKNGINILNYVKEIDKKIMVVFGGVHCTFDYEHIIKSGADFVFLNEADDTFPDFVNYLQKRDDFDSLHGFAFNNGDSFQKIPYKKFPDFKNLPTPAWKTVDIANYHKITQVCGLKNLVTETAPTAIVQTLRGCIARCTFCSVRNFNGFGVRMRDPDDVVDEIEYLVKNFGVKYLEIVDDDFTADLKRAIAICDKIIERGIKISWSLDNGIRLLTITEELAEKLIKSGCGLISVGVESGNKEIMHRVKKPLTLDGLYKKMEMMQKYPEIYVKGNFIVGFPFETYDQLQDTFRVASEIDFDWRIFSIYSPLVGTEAMNYFDEETRDEINFSENSYGKIEMVADGYKDKQDFYNDVYLHNLKTNFLNNPNYLGRRMGKDRAIKDFKRILDGTAKDHAVAMYCMSLLKRDDGKEEFERYLKDYKNVIANDEKWAYFCSKLNLPYTDKTIDKHFFAKFRSGREMEGEIFAQD